MKSLKRFRKENVVHLQILKILRKDICYLPKVARKGNEKAQFVTRMEMGYFLIQLSS